MLLDLHKNYGFSPEKQTANEYASPCPGCGGNDRFIVFAEKNTFWCRQCGKRGDAIQYLREFRGMSFPDAARATGNDIFSARGKSGTHSASKRPATSCQAPSGPTTPKKEQPARWRETAGRFIAQTTKTLQNSPELLTWLRLERGITQETAQRFQLGWIDHDCFRVKEEWGLPDGKRLFIPSGLVIPWQGKRLRIRRDNPGEYNGKANKKYYNVTCSDMEPMTIGTPHETTAIIVESELDAILLAQEIKREVFIVALGSCAVKPDDALLNVFLSCPAVLVVLDTDEAGAKASTWWLENVSSTYRTLTPKAFGKDITEAFLNGLDLNEWIGVSMEFYAESVGGIEPANF